MYLPPHFKSDDQALAVQLMREHPLASLISVEEGGLPFVTHLPLHVDQRPDGLWLLGHVARPNAHGKLLAAGGAAVAAFLGPHGYLSPRIYPDTERVPSWNYVAVHCTVQARILEGEAAKDSLLKLLIADHEPAYAEQWRSLPQAFTHKMLAGITAFELQVLRWEFKIKLNQHRPQFLPALHAGYAAGNERERALAGWIERAGFLPAATPEGDAR